MATFPPDRRSPIIPDPTTAASSKAVPRASATAHSSTVLLPCRNDAAGDAAIPRCKPFYCGKKDSDCELSLFSGRFASIWESYTNRFPARDVIDCSISRPTHSA